MTIYAVTGATGNLGGLAIAALLDGGVAPADIVAVARSADAASGLAARGISVREGDYDVPETLARALVGVDRLLLVSSDATGRRVDQHAAVIDAARTAGVSLIAYTSILDAGASGNPLAPDHRATEALLADAGVPFIALRNGWYTENYTEQLSQYLAAGEITGAAADGRISAAARRDYAAAAVAALIGGEPASRTYELGGPSFGLAELAAMITRVTGTAVRYRSLSVEGYVSALRDGGMDADTARFIAEIDASIARGELETSSDDLAALLGRPPTPPEDVLRVAG